MKIANEKVLEERLQSEGFRRTYVWQDGPDVFYPEHTHATETTHIILDGEMTLTMNGGTRNGGTRTYRPGERCDVPASAKHSARMGLNGCRYLIGER